MCVGCRRRRPVGELIRLVGTPDGQLARGTPGMGGRGAWLCADRQECVEAAGERALSRALRRPVDPSAVRALRAMMGGRGRMEACVTSPWREEAPAAGPPVRSDDT